VRLSNYLLISYCTLIVTDPTKRLLTKVTLVDMESLHRALDILHKHYRVPNVVISSIALNSWLAAALPSSILPPSASASTHLLCISSSLPTAALTKSSHVYASDPMRTIVHAQCVPLIPGYFSGVGDLFSALLLAHFHPDQTPENIAATPLSEAVSQALTKTHAVLLVTQAQAEALPEEERMPTDDELDKEYPLRKTRRMRGRELALVQGQDLIRGTGHAQTREMMLWDGFWDTRNEVTQQVM